MSVSVSATHVTSAVEECCIDSVEFIIKTGGECVPVGCDSNIASGRADSVIDGSVYPERLAAS